MNPPSSMLGVRGRFREAFGLPEVVMALGIFVFAVVSIIGMLPVGLGVARDSAEKLAMIRIAEGVAEEVRAGRWRDEDPGILEFDSAGHPTASSVFEVRLIERSMEGGRPEFALFNFEWEVYRTGSDEPLRRFHVASAP